jgi:hypothetical protein
VEVLEQILNLQLLKCACDSFVLRANNYSNALTSLAGSMDNPFNDPSSLHASM